MVFLFTFLFTINSNQDSLKYFNLVESAIKCNSTNLELAIQYIDSAKKILPLNANAYLWAGSFYLDHNSPNSSYYEIQRGFDLLSDKDEMINYFINRYTNFRSKEDSLNFSTAFDLIENGKPAESIILLNKLLINYPTNAKLLYELGFASVELGNFYDAIYYLEQGRRILPCYGKILSELQYCYSEVGNIQNTKSIINERLKYLGDSPELYHELAFTYLKNSEYRHAFSAFEYNISNFPDFILSYFSYAQVMFNDPKLRISEKDKIIRLLETFLKLAKKDERVQIGNVNIDEVIPEVEKMLRELST